jgi:DNA-binding MurR/RpiR family transcriptional regulator
MSGDYMSENIDSYKKIIEIYDTLSKQHKKAADYIIANFDEILTQSITKTADKIGVSKPTLIRFSRLLGFSGYPEFRQNMLSLYKESMAPATRLERYLNDFNKSNSNFSSMVGKEIEYLNKAASSVTDKDILDAVNLIYNADTVYCFAAGPSEAMTNYLSFRLTHFGLKITPVISTGNYAFEKLPVISNKDVVIIYKFNKPTNNYDSTVSYLNEKNIPTILITDIKTIQMIKKVDVVLYARRGPFGVFSSPLVPFAITNALIVGIAKKLGNRAIENLEELNMLQKKYVNSDLSELSIDFLAYYENLSNETIE